MFGLSFSHLILLSALALIFIGPKQLPEVARQIGKFLNEMKRVGSDFSKTIVDARESTNEALTQENKIINPEPISYVDPTIDPNGHSVKASEPEKSVEVTQHESTIDPNKVKHD
jgi:Sec-independent protein translocase protein TatA